MKNKIYLILILIVCLFSGACSSALKRENELLRQSVYATNEAIKVKRYDLAKRYSEQSVRIVPPPVTKLPVREFTYSEPSKDNPSVIITRPVVVLPKEDLGFTVKSESDEELRRQNAPKIKLEDNEVKLFTGKVDDLQRDKEKIVEKAEKSTFWSKLKGFFTFGGIFGVLGGVGLIVLFFLNPPLFFSIFGLLKSIVSGFLNGVKRFIDAIRNRFSG